MFDAFWECGPSGPHHSKRGGTWPFDPGFIAGFWEGPGRRRGGPFRAGRMFEQGDLKYVILQLLDEKSRHGYEIIKELEDRFGGMYSPSPGTVYPTLTMLEDLGYARTSPEPSGKKIYEITPEGKAYLVEHKSTVDDIFERMTRFGASFFSEAMMEVNRAFADLGRRYGNALRGRANKDRLRQMKEILERAAKEIDNLEG